MLNVKLGVCGTTVINSHAGTNEVEQEVKKQWGQENILSSYQNHDTLGAEEKLKIHLSIVQSSIENIYIASAILAKK